MRFSEQENAVKFNGFYLTLFNLSFMVMYAVASVIAVTLNSDDWSIK